MAACTAQGVGPDLYYSLQIAAFFTAEYIREFPFSVLYITAFKFIRIDILPRHELASRARGVSIVTMDL